MPDSLDQALSGATLVFGAELSGIDKMLSFQTPLLSSDNSLVSELANLSFGSVDQEFLNAAAATLAGAQAFVADPSEDTVPGLVLPDFQYIGASFDVLLPDLFWRDVGPVFDALGDADASVAGSDLASLLGPDLFF